MIDGKVINSFMAHILNLDLRMKKLKEGVMKKVFLVLALMSFAFALPMYANANIIGNVTLKETFQTGGSVSFDSGANYGNYALDYHVSLNNGPYAEAFCVEGQDGPQQIGPLYTLLTIDSGLSAFSLDASTYLAAGWVATLWKMGGATKEAAQIAIWEIIFDWGNLDLSTGTFRSNAASYNATAAAILANLGSPDFISGWALAVNPTVTQGQPIGNTPYQNYLVQYNVSEPMTMILFGLGLIGLAALTRKE